MGEMRPQDGEGTERARIKYQMGGIGVGSGTGTCEVRLWRRVRLCLRRFWEGHGFIDKRREKIKKKKICCSLFPILVGRVGFPILSTARVISAQLVSSRVRDWAVWRLVLCETFCFFFFLCT